tara:strand:- start:65 stop:448 length:384 start_codon:yes stop_codon:yes gene_type:complete
MSYNNNIIMTLGVDDESTYGRKLGITVAVDTLGMCTISFGTSYSIRIPEDDVNALQDVLCQAVNQLAAQRNEAEEFESASREAEEEMATEADDYDPEDDWALAKDEEEQLRRDEKRGLYPDKWDYSN